MLVRCAGVRAPPKTSAMIRSAQPSGIFARPARASPPRTRIRQPLVQRQLPADELDQRGVDLDDLLGGARPGRRDIAGQRQGAAAQMDDAQRFAGRCGQVGDVPEPPLVGEVEVRRVVEVHMGLRGTVDQQRPAARPVPVGP